MNQSYLVRAAKKPHKVPLHLFNEARQFYRRRQTHSDVIDMVSEVLDSDRDDVKKYYETLANNKNIVSRVSHFGSINGRYSIPNQGLLAYLSCKVIKPELVIETGVHRGTSSTLILQALEENGKGKLHSIDLPGTVDDPVVDPASPYGTVSYKLPDESKVGSNISEGLKHRWNLHLGRSDEVLEPLLSDLGTIGIFLHDSDHSYENMMFEFNSASKSLSSDGCILSDDIDWNTSFSDFCERNADQWSQLTDKKSKKFKKNETMVGVADLDR